MANGKGRSPDDGGDKKSDRPLAWAELYWRVQRHYPNHPRFTGRNFGRCPVYVIQEAIESAQQAELSRLKDENRVIANVGYLMLLSKGCDSIGREQINDWEMIELIQRAKAAVPKQVAEAWLRMNEKGCLPRWAVQQIDVDVMRRAAL